MTSRNLNSEHLLAFKFGLFLAAGLVSTGAPAAQLRIGDAAPKLSVDRWLQGPPVTEFQKGHVYVLEFWATWCGPCRVAMPHLSELSKKHAGKATFIGVNIWEEQHVRPDGDYDKVINEFLNENRDLMSYNICTGSKDGAMATNWMKAANQGGIPATFVVDQEGKIAWIGHPIDLDEPLAKIIEGTFDLKTFGEQFNKRLERQLAFESKMDEVLEPAKKAISEKRFKDAVRICDRGIAKYPDMTMLFAITKFDALMSMGHESAYKAAVKIRRDRDQAYVAGGSFLMKDGLPRKFYELALEIFLDQIKKWPEIVSRKALVAKAYSRLGDHQMALEYQTQFVEAMRRSNAGEVVMRELEKELEQYKKAAGKGN